MTFKEAKRTLYAREHSAMIDAFAYPDNEYMEGVFDGIHEAAKIFSLTDPGKGKWIKGIGENGVNTSLYCDQCGYENGHWYKWNYCPNCGAPMEE